MSEVLFFIALLVGVISIIGNAVSRAQRRADTANRQGRAGPMIISGPTPGQHLPTETKNPGAVPLPGAETWKRVPAPSQLSGGGRGNAVRDKMERMFREEEALLTAFIFHEILGPPRSLRRR